jgi:hypothetical protein
MSAASWSRPLPVNRGYANMIRPSVNSMKSPSLFLGFTGPVGSKMLRSTSKRSGVDRAVRITGAAGPMLRLDQEQARRWSMPRRGGRSRMPLL